MRTQINEQLHSAGTTVRDTNDRVLDSVLDANRRVVDFMVETAEQFPTMPVELPYADRLPTPAEAGKQYLEFVERTIELNRDFTERVIDMLPEFDVEQPARKTPKTATRKSTKTASKATTSTKSSKPAH